MDEEQEKQTALPIITIEGNTEKLTAKLKQHEAEARVYKKYGSKVLRIKLDTLTQIGEYATRVGLKKIGHGKIILAGETAEERIQELNELVIKLTKDGVPPDSKVLIELLKLQKEYAQMLFEIGKEHLAADRAPAPLPDSPHGISIPFPPGTPMVVAVGQGAQLPQQDKAATQPPSPALTEGQ